MWFSSGGTKSVLHYDSAENINCLFAGTKKLYLIDPNKYSEKVRVFATPTNLLTGFSVSFRTISFLIGLICMCMSLTVCRRKSIRICVIVNV